MWIFTYNIVRVLRLTLTDSYLAVGRVDVSCRSPGSNSWDPFSPNSSQPRRNTPRLSCSENTNTHTERKKRISVSYLNCMWSHWGPRTKLSRLVNRTAILLDKILCPFLFAAHKQTNQNTCSTEIWHHPCLFPAFIPDYQITANLIFLKCHLSTTLRPLHLRSTQDSSCSFTYSSFSGYHLSLPPSPPSALRLSLCWMQPETRSPLLFPGSHPLCFQAWRGKTLSSPLPLGVTISSPPWLSQVLALSMSHIDAQHADNHIQYRLAQFFN